jgi:hypothetical protein
MYRETWLFLRHDKPEMAQANNKRCDSDWLCRCRCLCHYSLLPRPSTTSSTTSTSLPLPAALYNTNHITTPLLRTVPLPTVRSLSLSQCVFSVTLPPPPSPTDRSCRYPILQHADLIDACCSANASCGSLVSLVDHLCSTCSLATNGGLFNFHSDQRFSGHVRNAQRAAAPCTIRCAWWHPFGGATH